MKSLKYFFLLFIITSLQSCNQQSNWNQYLGPDRNAISTGEKILNSWTEEGPKELWAISVGEGYGGASIFDEEVFILDRKKGEMDILRCIDLNTGEELWNYSYEAAGELPYPGSRAVPTVDKKHIWSVGPYGDLYCINKKTHQAVWNMNLVKEYEGELTNWGFSQSPIIYKNMVIVAPHGKKAGVTAFHKLTGELIWQSRPLSGINFHPSPAIANFGGVDQIIVISSYSKKDSTKTNEVAAFDANSGKELWTYHGLHSFANITPPIVIDENRLFLTDCSYNDKYEPVSILLEINKEGDEFNVKELFLTEEAGCKMHPAVFFEDHFYMNSNKRPEQMACLNLKGENVWANDSVPGFEMGGLIMVDELIINQNGKNGDIHLIEPSPEAYKELGKASFFNSKKTQAWSPMAFSNGKLIIRDLEKMVCIDLQNP